MRSARWCVLALALALSACEENETSFADPEPVAPVEVTADPEGDPASDPGTEDVDGLRARVAQLEQQLAQCRGDAPPATAPPMAPIPEGVDVPAGAAAADGPDPDEPDEPGASPSEPRHRDRDPVGLPNPIDLLLGN